MEKLPFFALSAAASAITFVFQRHTLSVVSLNDLPIATRLANVLVSYASYVGVMVWPSKLAAHYPFQVEGYSPTSIALSGALLACISITAFVLHRRAPYVIMGWLWFVGTLVPVVGFVQIGTQRMADRYSYLPSIGLFIMVAWSVSRLFGARARNVMSAAGALTILVCVPLTIVQIGYWKNSETLWTRVLSLDAHNEIGLLNLGSIYMEQGRYEDAIPCFDGAARINPSSENAFSHLGLCYQRLARFDQAVANYRYSLRLNRESVSTLVKIALCLMAKGQDAEAVGHLQEAVRIDGNATDAIAALGVALTKIGDAPKAAEMLRTAISRNPNDAILHNVLGIALMAA
ncbi:MAG: tetratricopeptide repeat protein, partial [Patescibacteria group bacterium]